MNPIKEFGMGTFILLVCSPLIFLLILDMLGSSDENYKPFLSDWQQAIVMTCFFVGFILTFTTNEEKTKGL